MHETYLNGYENLVEIKFRKSPKDWFGVYVAVFLEGRFIKFDMTEEFYTWYVSHCPNKTSSNFYYDIGGYICVDGLWDKDINLIQEMIKAVFSKDLSGCNYELTISKKN